MRTPLAAVARLVADTVLVAALLFISAGTIAWWRAWTLLITLLAVRVVGALAVHRVNPALIEERAKLPLHADQPPMDRLLLVAVLATGFLGLPVLAGLDEWRWHVLPPPGTPLAASGLALFVAGWMLKSTALRANAFATTTVRIQSERAHAVADSGIYAIIRHPFYAADPLIFIGLGLWLESYFAVACAVIPLSLMLMRLQLEERFLRRQLPGYPEYMLRVRYRLIPGVW